MKIVTVVGARPQFIKAAVVSHELRDKHKEILVHTGQHYDYNMSGCFFDELNIPKPDYNLGISGGTHASMTGRMMIEIEDVLIKEQPDVVLVYGDTNSTLAAVLAAAKLHIPICHVEAGCRTYSLTNPEEINRVCVDHISTLLLTSTEGGMVCLEKEGLRERAFFVGDPMFDAFLEYRDKINLADMKLTTLDGKETMVPHNYIYLTCHREENTKYEELQEILCAMGELNHQVVYPVHPRNTDKVNRIVKSNGLSNIIICKPVGYLESLCLVNNSDKIVTDSGGLQREAFFANKKCLTVLDFACWPETMINNCNELCAAEREDILEKINHEQHVDKSYLPFGDGQASKKIVKMLEIFQEKR